MSVCQNKLALSARCLSVWNFLFSSASVSLFRLFSSASVSLFRKMGGGSGKLMMNAKNLF
jgi:hypothetical protein